MKMIRNSKVKNDRHTLRPVLLKILFFFLGTSYLLILIGCKEKVKPGTVEIKRQVIPDVTVTEVYPSKVEEYYETSGTVRVKKFSIITRRVMGMITSLMVKEGDKVHAGQVLMTIDDRDVAERVKASEKTLEAAQLNKSLMDTTYQRYKQLYDERALTRQEIDQVETQKKIADAEYERAKAMLAETQVYYGFTKIIAPIAGVITEKKTDLGSMAAPGMPSLNH